ncbi:MAG: hypothetical protein HKP03_02430 [Xanthomonadales bacterium]|nr:hypothetical protein [Xanthomonadales bacterium]
MPDTSQNKVKDAMDFQFDEIISAPCRLGILATLVPGEAVSFTKMKSLTSLSDGNLHVQSRKLADAGYIDINKIKKGKRYVTQFSITKLGRESLRLYVTKLQDILNAGAGAQAPARAAPEAAQRKKPAPQRAKPTPQRPGKADKSPGEAPKPSAQRPKQPKRRRDDSAVWL